MYVSIKLRTYIVHQTSYIKQMLHSVVLSLYHCRVACSIFHQDLAADIVRFTLSRLHLIGIGAGVVFLVANFLRHSSFASFARTVVILVLLMIVLTALSQFAVSAHMAQLRHQMEAQTGSVAHTTAENPLRAEFEQYHHYSVWIEGTVLLLGIAAIYFNLRNT